VSAGVFLDEVVDDFVDQVEPLCFCLRVTVVLEVSQDEEDGL